MNPSFLSLTPNQSTNKIIIGLAVAAIMLLVGAGLGWFASKGFYKVGGLKANVENCKAAREFESNAQKKLRARLEKNISNKDAIISKLEDDYEGLRKRAIGKKKASRGSHRK